MTLDDLATAMAIELGCSHDEATGLVIEQAVVAEVLTQGGPPMPTGLSELDVDEEVAAFIRAKIRSNRVHDDVMGNPDR